MNNLDQSEAAAHMKTLDRPPTGSAEAPTSAEALQKAMDDLEQRVQTLQTQLEPLGNAGKELKGQLKAILEGLRQSNSGDEEKAIKAAERALANLEAQVEGDLKRILDANPNLHRKEGERVRLADEMKNVLKNNKYGAAYQMYEEMLGLNALLTASDHYNGGVAALNVGRIQEAKDAFQKATRSLRTAPDAGMSTLASNELVNIAGSYGGVFIALPLGEGVLTISELPFDPRQRRAFEYAQKTLEGGERFIGLLPVGDYTLGGISFEVKAGQTLIKIPPEPEKVKSPSQARLEREEKPPQPNSNEKRPLPLEKQGEVVRLIGDLGNLLGREPVPHSGVQEKISEVDALMAKGSVELNDRERGILENARTFLERKGV
jgi:tetratricopeptide (TPR) repeat protein